MNWEPDAEQALKKVPFFVRKRVRARVEEHSRAKGHATVSLADVKATQQQYLHGEMSRELKGYQLDACFGSNGCPNRALVDDTLMERVESLLKQADLLAFLRERVPGELRFHHELRVTLADCPNACSQPQIKDIGIIGACLPRVGEEPCTACGACVRICREAAIDLKDEDPPGIDLKRCVACGKCIGACASGTIIADASGFRVLLGGKLGRHPRLAMEMPGLYSAEAVLQIVGRCLEWYKANCRQGERFSKLLESDDMQRLAEEFAYLRLDEIRD